MIVGDVTLIGSSIGSGLLIVGLALDVMLLVVVMVDTMLSLTLVMMILLTQDPAHYAMLLFKRGLCGLCSRETW